MAGSLWDWLNGPPGAVRRRVLEVSPLSEMGVVAAA